MTKVFAIFSANYLPNLGGVEKYTHNLASALAKQGDRCIIITNNVFELPEIESIDPGVDIVRLPCLNLLKGRYPIPKKNKRYESLLSLILEKHIDYVIINTRFYPHSFLGARIAASKGITPILIDHGSAHLTFGCPLVDPIVEFVEHFLTNRMLSRNIVYYAVSQKGVLWLKHFNIEAKGVLHNSIDANAFVAQASSRNFREELSLKSTTFLVAFTGRYIPEKGILKLINAAKILENKPIAFIFAGAGPLESEISKCCLSNVYDVGRLCSSDIAALLKTADVFCLPTRSEGFSTSLLEASACGTTSLITDVGGVDELIPSEQFGYVLNNSHPCTIAEGILKLFASRYACAAMGANSQQHVQSNFSWGETASKAKRACEKAQLRDSHTA